MASWHKPQLRAPAPGALGTRSRWIGTLSLILWASTLPASPPAAQDQHPSAQADLLVEDGTIYTLAGDQPSPVEALAIRDGAVMAVGSREQLRSWIGPQTQHLDLHGDVAVPGLVDAHGHLFNLGRLLTQVDLRGTSSPGECIARARAWADSLAPGAWLRGRGWDQNDWVTEEYPNRGQLDAVFGDRPVYLRRVDGHASWVNGAALARAGFTAATPDPEGGEILRGPDGAPTGILIDAADDSMRACIEAPSKAELDAQVHRATQAAARAGLTGVHEMGITLRQLAALRRAQARGGLPLRVVVYLGGDETLAAFQGGPQRPAPGERIRVEGVKLYADGALGSRGAALLADYSDRPGHRGLLIQSPAALRAKVAHAFERGFAVAIHAIGDRANRVALDAIEDGHADALAENASLGPIAALRARIEHAQVLSPDDLPRFAALGVIPSMQPTHCTSDMPWAPQRLGEARLRGAYAWRSLRDTGCILPLGSDFPVEDVSPLLGLYAARTRQTPGGTPPGGWSPGQRLTALEALLGFTAWPAEACGVPAWGRLVPGCRADLTVLSADPLAADADALLKMRVLGTVVEGEVAYAASPDGIRVQPPRR